MRKIELTEEQFDTLHAFVASAGILAEALSTPAILVTLSCLCPHCRKAESCGARVSMEKRRSKLETLVEAPAEDEVKDDDEGQVMIIGSLTSEEEGGT